MPTSRLDSWARGLMRNSNGLSAWALGLLLYGQKLALYPAGYPLFHSGFTMSPDYYDLPFEVPELRTPDGMEIRTFLLLQEQTTETDKVAPTVIMFHGNGMTCGDVLPIASTFYSKIRCNVLVMSYRGYATSDGSPSEKGLRIDAQTGLDYITSHPVLSKSSVILFGQSMGGAVAIDLASRNPSKIQAIIVENTFTSFPRVIGHHVPPLSWIPLRFLLHQKWDSLSRIRYIPAETPVLMLSGARDQVVPPEHMMELWKAFKARHKEGAAKSASRFVTFPSGTHNDTFMQRGYTRAIKKFMARTGFYTPSPKDPDTEGPSTSATEDVSGAEGPSLVEIASAEDTPSLEGPSTPGNQPNPPPQPLL